MRVHNVRERERERDYILKMHVLSACSDEKCERCLQRGASYVLNYKTENVVDLVKGMTKVGSACYIRLVP